MKQGKYYIKKGSILLAEPFMLDGNFQKALVLLCEHSQEEGTVGFILNKELDIPICDLIADFPHIESNAFFGGPVATDTVHYIHNIGEDLEGSIEVAKGVWWGGDFEQLKFQISTGLIDESNIKFLVGYSGWDPNQLVGELNLGSWVVSKMKKKYLFDIPTEDLWELAMSDKGDTYKILSEIPTSKETWS